MTMTAPTPTEVLHKLRVARPGLRFSEVMAGMITMGVTDPVEGYKNDAAIAMRLQATVTLPNQSHRAVACVGFDTCARG
jgi:hypothetical protein